MAVDAIDGAPEKSCGLLEQPPEGREGRGRAARRRGLGDAVAVVAEPRRELRRRGPLRGVERRRGGRGGAARPFLVALLGEEGPRLPERREPGAPLARGPRGEAERAAMADEDAACHAAWWALDEAAAEIQWVCLQYLRRKAQRDLDAKANKR